MKSIIGGDLSPGGFLGIFLSTKPVSSEICWNNLAHYFWFKKNTEFLSLQKISEVVLVNFAGFAFHFFELSSRGVDQKVGLLFLVSHCVGIYVSLGTVWGIRIKAVMIFTNPVGLSVLAYSLLGPQTQPFAFRMLMCIFTVLIAWSMAPFFFSFIFSANVFKILFFVCIHASSFTCEASNHPPKNEFL